MPFWNRFRGLSPAASRLAARDAEDRGIAKFFHGREEPRAMMELLCHRARQHRSGTTVLVQGPPGVGKTALLHQLASEAQLAGWKCAELEPQALYDPVLMTQILNKSYATRLRRTWQGDAKLRGGSRTSDFAGVASVSKVLARLAPRQGLLLLLDEVQRLRDGIPSADLMHAKSTLEQIHNGRIGQSIILLAGGLSTSKTVFDSLGVSQFRSGCVVDLGRLLKRAEYAVIRDWLVKVGQAREDTTTWLNALAAETHGWPQHIMCYVQPAAEQVRRSDGALTESGLAIALECGRQAKVEYYQGRLEIFDRAVLSQVARMLRESDSGVISKKALVEALQTGPAYDDPVEVFSQLLDKGVISRTGDNYSVPIPSMRDWLMDRFSARA